jgi:hypothetical protein
LAKLGSFKLRISRFQSTLREAWQYRQANEEQYATSRDEEITDVEFLPWTGSGDDGDDL